MRRSELEHAIRAATTILKNDRVIIIGSQSILGSWDDELLPPEATFSDEVDICPMNDDQAESLATMLDAAIGEFSNFHATHGFYVQGVGRSTAILPRNWEYRLQGVRNDNTNNATGLCLDPYDLCAAKLIAGREKDYAFVLSLIAANLITRTKLSARLELIDTAEPRRQNALDWVFNE